MKNAWLALLLVAPLAGTVRPGAPRIERALAEYSSAMETVQRDQRLKRFARAEQLFRQLIDGDEAHPPVRNASLYVNLGNAALQAERIGPAIAAYRQALLLNPRGTQAIQNLAYARSLLPTWIRQEDSRPWVDTLFFWRAFASRGQVVVFAAASFLAATIFFSVGVVKQQPVVRNIALAPLLIWGITTVSLAFDRDGAHQQDVVVISETILYAADSENSAPLPFKPLPSGAEVLRLQQRDQWSEIQLHNTQTGWVRTSAIRHVAP